MATETPRTTSKKHAILCVLSVTGFGLLLRLLFIDFAYPFNYHPDEHTTYDIAVAMVRTGDFNPHWFHWPSLILYVESAIVAVIHGATGSSLDVLMGNQYSPGMYPEGQWEYLIWGRIFVALLGALTCGFMAAIGMRIGRMAGFGARGVAGLGLFAGIAVALAPLHLTHSHYLTTDVPATFGLAATLYFSIRVLDDPRLRWVMLGALFAGIGAGFKYTGCAACIPLGLAVLVSETTKTRRAWLFGVAVVGSVVAFILTTPYSVLDYEGFSGGLAFDAAHYTTGHIGHTVENGFVSILKTLQGSLGMGLALAVLSYLSLAVVVSKAARSDFGRLLVCLIGLIGSYALLFSNAAAHFDRSALPLIPALVAAATIGVAVCARLPGQRTPRLVGFAAVAILLATSLGSVSALETLASDRTETRAHDWIEEHIPHNASVFREYYTPQVSPERYRVLVSFTASNMEIDSLDLAGDDFIVLSSWIFTRFTSPTEGDEEQEHRFDFYEAVFRRPVVAVFCPESGVAGPEVWIFTLSARARALQLEPTISGDCNTNWPWLPSPDEF